jgi:hypothetical protein
MAQDFDEFPLDDPILSNDGLNKFGNIWRGSISTFFQTLIGYMSQNGFFVPKLTTAQRDAIQQIVDDQGNQISPSIGQLIYNTTTDELQIFKPLPTGWVVVI